MLEKYKDIIQLIKLTAPFFLGTIAGAWTYYKFYYQKKKDAKEKTGHLILESNIKKIGEKESFKVVKFSLKITNESNTKMYVLADYVNIHGISMLESQLAEEEYLQKTNEKIQKKRFSFLHRFVTLKEKKIVFCGKIFDYNDYWWLEPNEKLVINRIAYIPDYFDYAELSATVYYSVDKDWLNVNTIYDEGDKGLNHKVTIAISKFKGEDFHWHNKKHLKLHYKYRNAEINNTSLLFIK